KVVVTWSRDYFFDSIHLGHAGSLSIRARKALASGPVTEEGHRTATHFSNDSRAPLRSPSESLTSPIQQCAWSRFALLLDLALGFSNSSSPILRAMYSTS